MSIPAPESSSRAGVILGGLAILVVLALAVFIFLPKSNPNLPPVIGTLTNAGISKINADCDSVVKVNDTKNNVSCYVYIGCNNSGSISCIDSIISE